MSTGPHVHRSTCPHVHTSTFPHVHMSTCLHVHMSTRPHVHTSACPHVHTSTCPHVHTFTCPHVHMSTCSHVHMSTCPRVYTSTCSHFHTSTYMSTRPQVRGEKCGLDKNLESKTICLTFWPSQFRLAGGYSLSISGKETAKEKHFYLHASGLMLFGQVKRPIWIQTDICRVRCIAPFKLLVHRQILITRNI